MVLDVSPVLFQRLGDHCSCVVYLEGVVLQLLDLLMLLFVCIRELLNLLMIAVSNRAQLHYLHVDRLSGLPFLLCLLLSGSCIGLQFFKISSQVVNGLAKIIISFANAHRLITIFHKFGLKTFNLVPVLLFVLIQSGNLSFNFLVLLLFALDLGPSGCHFCLDICYHLTHSLNLRLNPFFCFLFLKSDLIL